MTRHKNGGGGAVKEAADRFTLPLNGVDKPRRGRPPKPNALTPAQRARAYRARMKADKGRQIAIMERKLLQAKLEQSISRLSALGGIR